MRLPLDLHQMALEENAVREASCVFMTAYALILLAGLTTLVQGRAGFDAWRASLGSPGALAFHGQVLVPGPVLPFRATAATAVGSGTQES